MFSIHIKRIMKAFWQFPYQSYVHIHLNLQQHFKVLNHDKLSYCYEDIQHSIKSIQSKNVLYHYRIYLAQ
jgi:hypothetical protein